MNGNPQYKVTVEIINPETCQQENIDEVIGFNEKKYPVNSYVLCKYHKGDINTEKVISPAEVPEVISSRLVQIQEPVTITDISFSDDREHVTIDGIKYKRVD